jgi:putative ABC transport system permease protein
VSVASLAEADFFVAAQPANVLETSGFLSDRVDREAALIPGVRSVVHDRYTFYDYGPTRVLLEGLGRGSTTSMYALAPPAAVKAAADGNATIVSQSFEEVAHVHVGDSITLEGVRGPVRLRVAAVVPALVWPGGIIAVSMHTLRDSVGVRGLSYLEVHLTGSASPPTVAKALRGLGGDALPQLDVVTGPQAVSSAEGIIIEVIHVLDAMSVVVILGSALAVLGGILLGLEVRRRQFGVLRALGVSRRRITAMIWSLVGSYAVAGLIIGLFLGQLMERAAVSVLERSIRTPFPAIQSGSAYAEASLGAAAVVVLVALIGSHRQGKARLLESVAYE